jgi:guanine deaminase
MNKKFIQKAIDLSRAKMSANEGGPFGCVVVKDGKIIAEGWNQVISKNDPTAHAEMQAIQKACQVLNNFQLTGCDVYTSCYPCPMCLGALYWTRPERIFYANTAEDAANIGFDDSFIYEQIQLDPKKRTIPFEQIESDEAIQVFKEWEEKEDRISY